MMKALQKFQASPSNELAVAAAELIIQSPGTKFNPDFIYGNCGTDKTRLLRAIQRAFREERKEIRVLYADGKQFALDLERAAEKGASSAFKEKYRNCDVLIVDGIDALVHREELQKIFMDLVDELLAENKQVIVASETSPVDLPVIGGRTSIHGISLICDITSRRYADFKRQKKKTKP